MGVTVCSIAGTNFAPYVKLLGPEGLDIPFAILTDFDPKGSEASQEDDDPDSESVDNSYGESRVMNHIMKALLPRKFGMSSQAKLYWSLRRRMASS